MRVKLLPMLPMSTRGSRTQLAGTWGHGLLGQGVQRRSPSAGLWSRIKMETPAPRFAL